MMHELETELADFEELIERDYDATSFAATKSSAQHFHEATSTGIDLRLPRDTNGSASPTRRCLWAVGHIMAAKGNTIRDDQGPEDWTYDN